MKWRITFYNQKVELETLGFPKGILANFMHIAEMIEEFGPALGLPYTKAVGGGGCLKFAQKVERVLVGHSFVRLKVKKL